MIPILICDDDTLWTQKLSREIERFQIASDWEVCLTHVSHTPEIFLQYLRHNAPRWVSIFWILIYNQTSPVWNWEKKSAVWILLLN